MQKIINPAIKKMLFSPIYSVGNPCVIRKISRREDADLAIIQLKKCTITHSMTLYEAHSMIRLDTMRFRELILKKT